MSSVTVVDYGLGNLHSVLNALAYLGVSATVAESGDAISAADRLILPGVGAFANGMTGLARREQVAPLRRAASRGTPLMGICLGMHLLFEQSEEFGLHEGLAIIPGNVTRIPAEGVKVPHVGWSRLHPSAGAEWVNTPLAKTPPGAWAYFVHSYRAVVRHQEDLMATAAYGPITIPAAVRRGAVYGLQFHPEKSGKAGLDMLATFCTL